MTSRRLRLLVCGLTLSVAGVGCTSTAKAPTPTSTEASVTNGATDPTFAPARLAPRTDAATTSDGVTTDVATSDETDDVATTDSPAMITDGSEPTLPLPGLVTETLLTSHLGPPMRRASANCAMNAPTQTGEVTYVSDGRLFSTDGKTIRCLSTLQTKPDRLIWNPPGTEALINSDQILLRDGRITATGFLRDNATARWSYPTGKNVIGVAKNGELAKRNPLNLKRTVLSSDMESVDEVVYQPAGTSVTVIGTGIDGEDDQTTSPGVFAMSNVGGTATQLVRNETAERVWNLAYDGIGRDLYFLAEHPRGEAYAEQTFHVHRYDRADVAPVEGRLSEPFTSTTPLDNLVVSEYDDDWAVRVGKCGASTLHLASGDDPGIDVRVSGISLEPVAWLPGSRLVVEQREPGVCDGPATLGILEDVVLTTLDTGPVTTAAVRAIRGKAEDMPSELSVAEA